MNLKKKLLKFERKQIFLILPTDLVEQKTIMH